MYEIIKQFNDSTFLSIKNNSVFVLKKIGIEDAEIYRKLIGLNNKNVIKVYELTALNDSFYAVCEYIHGKTLSEIIDTDGPLHENEAKRIITEICDGLESIHTLGIVHRDICPNNIMISEDGNVKIIDFGISRIEKSKVARDTQLLGTPGFAAPEQYGFKQTSNRSDIYSLGVLINYIMTGQYPNEKLVSDEFSEIVTRCIQMDDRQRYANVQEVKYAIDKKFKFYSYIQKIPGFRKDVWWHKAIAAIYYIMLFLFFIFSCFPDKKGIRGNIGSIVFVIFGMFVPVLTVFDFNDWIEKLPFTKNKKKSEQIFVRIFVSAIISFIATLIMGLL